MVRFYNKPPRRTIFVNVASYRDPECTSTVRDLFLKAKHPESISVGIVMQTEPEDNIYIYESRVKIIAVRAHGSKGACWARHMGYKLWDGEEYVLQIDSHMRFAQDWDATMLEQLDLAGSRQPLLTTYPPPYTPEDPNLVQQHCYLAAQQFGADGHLSQIGRIYNPPPVRPLVTALMSANFLFGPAQWIHDVPYDPHLYFSGEETTLAARLWTHGWDMYGPTVPVIWHRYGRDGRNLHWDDHGQWYVANASSMRRMRYLLANDPAPTEALIDIDNYSMGKARSYNEYANWSGIDYVTRSIAPHALNGDWK